MASWEEEELRKTICHLPKHKGKTWYDVIQRDRDYVDWALENLEFEEDLFDALVWGSKHVPDRI